MRKTHESFRLTSKEAIQSKIKPIQLESNVIAYEIINTDDEWENIVVIFNANPTEQSITIDQAEWTVIAESGQADLAGLRKIEGSEVKISGINSMILYKSGEILTVDETDEKSNSLLIWIVLIPLMVIVIVIIVRKRK